VIVPGKLFQPSLKFVGEAKLARDKKSRLLRKSVSYGRYEFYSTGPSCQCYKTFLGVTETATK
jgi:hypothetical protein